MSRYVLKEIPLWLAAVLVFALLPTGFLHAQKNERDSLEISLLTCAPGPSAYELYGHTAIRVQDFVNGDDVVFNYGIFDFDTPHFIWRFMLGETDYCIGALPFKTFAKSYIARGRSIIEQRLRLSHEEKRKIVTALGRDYFQEGWTYRYNFLYDNCTTRAINVITKSLDGTLEWPNNVKSRTFRQIIHETSQKLNPWVSLGQDLLLGQETDVRIGLQEQLFSPLYAKTYLSDAVVHRANGITYKLVAEESHLTPAKITLQLNLTDSIFTPLLAAILLVFIALANCWWEYHTGKQCRIFDNLLLLLIGGMGCIISFLFFFSKHPAVGSNWLVLLFNPLPWFYLVYKLRRNRLQKTDYFHIVVGLPTFLFCVASLLAKQWIPTEIYLLILTVLIRCAASAAFMRKANVTKRQRPSQTIK